MSRYSKSLWTRRRLLGTGAAALAAPVIAPRRAWAQANEIRVGWVSPTTGPIAAFGAADDYILGALESRFAEGVSINGTTWPVRLIRRDSQSNANRAAEVASQLILEDEVHLMLSSSTAETVLPVTDQCELMEVPSLSTDTPWDSFFFGRGGDPAVGFDWTYHFFWGASQIVNSYVSLWDQIPTNKKVGLVLGNDADGVALANPQVGMGALIAAKGYEIVDVGLVEVMADDYSAQIRQLKEAGVEIVTGAMIPPDWATFWTQSAQQGFRPNAATIAKALLFPSAIEAIGDAGVGLSTEIWWSPNHPYPSSLTGQSSREIADLYTQQTGAQWIQPMGYKHALVEGMFDVLSRCADPSDPGAMVEAIKTTNMTTLVGPVAFTGAPVPNACATPVVGGQWIKGTATPYDLIICENAAAPEIAVQGAFTALPGA